MKIMGVAGRLIVDRASVAAPIKCISRWPAVIFAVSRTARATGWINRLMVSMIINIGMRGVGVPWGRRWARVFLVLRRRPVATVPAHRGTAMARFMDSWVVGVNEWGRRPRRLVVAIKVIREISMRDQVRPLVLCTVIICFKVS